MANTRLMGTAVAIITLAVCAPDAHGQEDAREDLSPCPGSAPEPTQSAAWSVAFCNRTGHDLVIELHDNECPAGDWSRRGDVYQRILRRGESKTLPLCYASEPLGKKPAPGRPIVRIPGGKGIVTTWTVVGDCGERSRPLNLDAGTFYDRGDYKTGIILLQYPSGASHCVTDASSAAATAPSPSTPPVAAAPTAPGAAPAAQQPHSPSQAPGPIAPQPAAAAVNNRGTGPPTLSATVDAQDVVGRTVRVFAKDGAGYKCNFNLALTFTDGGGWNDRSSVAITGGDVEAPIVTRKYLKSVSRAQITSSKCTPM